MSIIDMLKSLADYIDIGKRVVNTVPGLLMAFAFLLLFSSPPDYFKSAFLAKSLRAAQDARDRARQEQNDLTAQLAVASGNKTLEDERLKVLKDSFCGSGKPAPCLITAPQFAAVRQQQAEAAAMDGKVSILKNQLAAKEDEVKTSEGVVKSLFDRVRDSGDFTKFINSGASGWLLFGILGMTIGTVLDPLNKALFLQWLPELTAKGNPPALFMNMVRPKPRKQTEELQRPIQFYIGSGVITQLEYDGLVSDYYRWSELSVGMILPILAMGAAWARQYQLKSGEWPSPAEIAGIAALTLGLSGMLLFVGLRRFREFQQQVNTFVRGRLKLRAKMLRQQREHVDLTTLSQLIYESKIAVDLLGAVRHGNGLM